jgi:hypothetical protein
MSQLRRSVIALRGVLTWARDLACDQPLYTTAAIWGNYRF